MLEPPRFFFPGSGLSLSVLAEKTGIRLLDESRSQDVVLRVAPIETAKQGDVTFLENSSYARFAPQTGASACFIAPKFADKLPNTCVALVSHEPYRAFAKAAALLFPSAMRPQSVFGAIGVSPGSFVHPEAKLEPDVIVDPGAVIGAGAEIGRGTLIGAHAVIGPHVKIGRDCAIGAHVTLTHALVGNRVIIHPGASIGQDGFGFAMGPAGHIKIPQIGRVILQDDVDIGANTTIDRGANKDTLIGEGTKIDNLVQIAHNVQIGRHCVIVGQVGISGSTILEDYVLLGGQVGLAGHLKIGMGAQIAAQSGVMHNISAGEKIMGSPAKPSRQFLREVATLSRLGKRSSSQD